MGWGWRKSIKLLPGLRLNLSHRGARIGVGHAPLSLSFHLFGRKSPTRMTASAPGTGLSFTNTFSAASRSPGRSQEYPTDEDGNTVVPPDLIVEHLEMACSHNLPSIALVDLPQTDSGILRAIMLRGFSTLADATGVNKRDRTYKRRDTAEKIAALSDDSLREIAQKIVTTHLPQPVIETPPAAPAVIAVAQESLDAPQPKGWTDRRLLGGLAIMLAGAFYFASNQQSPNVAANRAPPLAAAAILPTMPANDYVDEARRPRRWPKATQAPSGNSRGRN